MHKQAHKRSHIVHIHAWKVKRDCGRSGSRRAQVFHHYNAIWRILCGSEL
jgi:hypothetical protein